MSYVFLLLFLFACYFFFYFFFFFFSSRRRHTRYIGDWSSDVCSSDLSMYTGDLGAPGRAVLYASTSSRQKQIGRASCRERVEIAVVDGTLEKKKKEIIE